VNTVLLNNNEDGSKQNDPCSGEDSTEDTTQDSPKIDLTELYIGEGEAPEKDEIIVEVEVDNVEEDGNEEEQTVSNDDMEYNVTVDCWEIIVAQMTGWNKHQSGLEMPSLKLLSSLWSRARSSYV